MSAITHSAVAPNGSTVKVHGGLDGRSGFAYVKGHRVYGRYSRTYTQSDGFRSTFTPEGKWSYLLAANTASVQPVEGEDIERLEQSLASV